MEGGSPRRLLFAEGFGWVGVSMPRVRVIIPVRFYVSYVLDLEEATIEGLRKAIESGSFDPAGWESDPDFYENLWDAIKDAVYDGEGVEIEEVGG